MGPEASTPLPPDPPGCFLHPATAIKPAMVRAQTMARRIAFSAVDEILKTRNVKPRSPTLQGKAR